MYFSCKLLVEKQNKEKGTVERYHSYSFDYLFFVVQCVAVVCLVFLLVRAAFLCVLLVKKSLSIKEKRFSYEKNKGRILHHKQVVRRYFTSQVSPTKAVWCWSISLFCWHKAIFTSTVKMKCEKYENIKNSYTNKMLSYQMDQRVYCAI